jgi:hypothetical protein
MVRVCGVFGILGLTLCLAATALAADSGTIAVTEVRHDLVGRTLIVSGRVENRAASAVAALIVDAVGYAPSGDVVFQATDGIPWGMAPGKSERFTARLPINDRPVRTYTLQVALARTPRASLVSLRRIVDPGTYRPLLASAVQVKGTVRGDTLSVRADAGQWPVAQAVVEATISVPVFQSSNPMIVSPRNIDTVIVQVPGNGAADTPLPARGTELVSLRVIDAQPLTGWGE